MFCSHENVFMVVVTPRFATNRSFIVYTEHSNDNTVDFMVNNMSALPVVLTASSGLSIISRYIMHLHKVRMDERLNEVNDNQFHYVFKHFELIIYHKDLS